MTPIMGKSILQAPLAIDPNTSAVIIPEPENLGADPDFSTIPGLIAWIESDSDGVIFNQHQARTGKVTTVIIIPIDNERGHVLVWDRALTEAETIVIHSMADYYLKPDSPPFKSPSGGTSPESPPPSQLSSSPMR